MSIIGICIFGIVACILSVLLKQYKPEYSIIISACATCAIIVTSCIKMADIIQFIEQAFNNDMISDNYISVMLKTAGICYISHLGSSICKDCGQTALAQQIELVSKVSIIVLALPIFTELIKIVSSI